MTTNDKCVWIALVILVVCATTQADFNRKTRQRIDVMNEALRELAYGVLGTNGVLRQHFERDHGMKFAEIHAGLTAQESSNLWFAYQFHATNVWITNLPNRGIRRINEAKENR